MRIRSFLRGAGGAMAMMVVATGQEPLETTVVTAKALEEEEGTLLREELDMFSPESLEDLSGLVPSFHIVSSDSGGYGNVVTMRGSGNVLFFGPPAVGMTIDGVPQGNAFAYPTELLELEYAQVHRGPRGAYQGVNAPGGLVALQTPGPTEELEMKLTTEYGSYDLFGAAFRSSGPLGGDFSHTMQLYYREQGGFIDNTFLGGKRDDREVLGGLAKIFWNPSDDVEAWLSFSAQQIDDGSSRLTPFSNINPLTGGFVPNSDLFEVSSNLEGVTNIESYSVSGYLNKEYGWGDVTFQSSYSWWDLDPNVVDIDLSPINLFTTGIRQSQEFFTQEVRLGSLEDSALRWNAGLYFSDLDNSGETARFLGGPTEEIDFEIDQINVAFFANAGVDLTEKVSLDGGVRVDYYESDLDRVSSGLSPFPIPPVRDSRNDIYFSPSLGLSYQANDCLRLFVRSGLGIKPAGFTGFSSNTDLVGYEEERNWSNEIGLEYTPNEELRLGLRGYWNEISDYQVNQSLIAATDFVVANASQVTSRGLEAELTWQPTEALMVRASVGYTDAEFDRYSFDDPGGFTSLGVVPASTSNFDGEAVPFIPEFTGSVAARYSFQNGFYVQSSVRATGRTKYTSGGEDQFTEDSYTVVNAEIGYQGEDYSVALFANNLLDEEYYTFINSQVGPLDITGAGPSGGGSPGDPQVVGVRLTKEF